ncbi:MAG: S8 family serine peptidase, partial [Acidobacteriota bacterium]
MAIGAAGLSAGPAPLALVTGELQARLLRAPHERVRVIVQGQVAEVLEAAGRHGLVVHRVLDRMVVVGANAAEVALLQAEPAVSSLSGDIRMRPMMTVSDQAMSADQTRAGSTGPLGLGFPGVTGKGVGVAVVDSGIAAHKALGSAVVAAVSFVPGDPSVADAFGHGTHIAGIITGNGSAASKVTSLYKGGVAPGAHLVNVRVLGADGSGYTSSVIAGLDWVVANRSRYAIRIVNLALGHPVTAPGAVDPLCSSIAHVVQSGLV